MVKSKYAKKLKLIIEKERGIYKKEVKKTKKGLETLARYRLKSEKTRASKYWKKDSHQKVGAECTEKIKKI